METELRLQIAPADIVRLRRFALPDGWTRSAPKYKNLLRIYFDTDDLFLKQRAIALRVRRDGRRWIQTVKVGGGVKDGLHNRIEAEVQIAHDHPDFTKIDDPALAELFLSPELQGRIRPLFATEFRRKIRLLESPTGDVVEMALDQGKVRIDQGTTIPICEVKLELKTGNAAALYEAALVLLDWVPLHLEKGSKAERGYALCIPTPPPQPIKAPPLDLRRDVSVSQAFQSIARNCICHLQCNYLGLLTGEDVEYLHQMRIALRRLRSAMGLFSKVAPAINDVGLIAEVRWLAGELGEARDWDVFVTETLPSILSQAVDDPALQALGEKARAIAAAKREKARSAAASQCYQRLLLNLGAWLNRETWRVGARKRRLAMLDQPIHEWSGRLLDKRHNQLMKFGARLGELSGAEQHMLRIAGKKLRYAAEFLSHLHPGKDTGQYLKALADLQDILGKLNDHAVTRRLLDELQGKDRPDALHVRAIGEIVGWDICQASTQLESLGRVWSDFTKQKRFWKK
jgi:inorganic triphosphatase YgiF